MSSKMSIARDEALLKDEHGNLGRPLAANELPVPAIVATDGVKLTWRGVSTSSEKWTPSSKKMLDQFIKLVVAPPEQIRTFARQWGVLHICEHGLPASHVPESYSWKVSEGVGDCQPLGWPGMPEDDDDPSDEDNFSGWEPIESWRTYAREAEAIVDIAAMLHRNEKGMVGDWQALRENGDEIAKAPIDSQFEELFLIVKRWLVLGNVRPDIVFMPAPRGKRKAQNKPTITLGCCNPAWGHLFGALACQLMFMVTRIKGLAICSACGASYYPKNKQPRAGERHFCQRCRNKGEPKRLASADFRARKKAAEGKSTEEPKSKSRRKGQGMMENEF